MDNKTWNPGPRISWMACACKWVRAHLRALVNQYLTEGDLHTPPETPAPAFLPWFEIRSPFSSDLLYRFREATADSKFLAEGADDEL